jgi:hypothetical protein
MKKEQGETSRTVARQRGPFSMVATTRATCDSVHAITTAGVCVIFPIDGAGIDANEACRATSAT